MNILNSLRYFASTLFHRSKLEREMDEELRSHIQNRADDIERSGLPRDEAERRARIEFGGSERYKEECREQRNAAFRLETLCGDVRHGLRMLRKSPGFTAVAIITLALGVGANAVVFSLAYSMLLRSLPYPQSERIVTLWERNTQKGINNGPAAAANFYDWKQQNQAFSHIAGFAEWRFNLTGIGEPQSVSGALVTADFFATLGAPAAQGRTFRAEEDQQGKDKVAVVSQRLWNQIFGSSAGLANQTVYVNQTAMTVVGVMPEGFVYPSRTTDVWIPLTLAEADKANRDGKWLQVIARLKTGISEANAQENLGVIAQRLESSYPKSNQGWGVSIVSLRDSIVKDARSTLWILLGSVALLLLLACVNVSSLILAQATYRANELSVRFAIGATRSRIFRQLLTESILLVALGDLLALLLAFWSLSFIRTWNLSGTPWMREMRLDLPVIGFAVGLSLGVALLIGMASALRASRQEMFNASRQTSKAGKAALHTQLGSGRLVVAQISLAFVLMIAAALFANSFLRLSRVDPGFRVQNVLSAHLSLPRSKYRTNQQQADFFASVIERLRGIAGVRDVGGVSDLPLLGNRMSFKILIKDSLGLSQSALPEAGVRWVTPGYFHTIGMRMRAGRSFSDDDYSTATPVAVVSQSTAGLLWPSRNPVGERLRLEEDPRWFTIVGVVDDIKQESLATNEPAAVYFPYAQKSEAWLNWISLVVSTDGNPKVFSRTVREQVWSVDRDQPVTDLASLESYFGDSVAMPRLRLLVIGGFSLIALCLAVVGVYGTVSFSVAQRTHEIGIRMALGAERRDVLVHFLTQGFRSILFGLGIGLVVAAPLTRAMASQLFAVRPFDAATYLCVGLLLTAAALAACYLPAHRATKTDPITSLHYE